jgi:hypothetical protein
MAKCKALLLCALELPHSLLAQLLAKLPCKALLLPLHEQGVALKIFSQELLLKAL